MSMLKYLTKSIQMFKVIKTSLNEVRNVLRVHHCEKILWNFILINARFSAKNLISYNKEIHS